MIHEPSAVKREIAHLSAQSSLITMKTFCIIIALAALSGCAATKVVTVPLKASASIIGGTADLLD